MKTTDTELASAAAGGDRDAFSALLARHYDSLFRVCFRLSGSRPLAEDLTQDICLALPAKLRGYRAEAKFTTWLYRVVANLCTDWLRKARGQDLESVPEPEDDAPGAEAGLQQAARAQALEDALRALPDRQRQAVILRHLEGFTNPEIAEVMDIGVEAVESLTARGKRALAASLGGRRAELGYEDG